MNGHRGPDPASPWRRRAARQLRDIVRLMGVIVNFYCASYESTRQINQQFKKDFGIRAEARSKRH